MYIKEKMGVPDELMEVAQLLCSNIREKTQDLVQIKSVDEKQPTIFELSRISFKLRNTAVDMPIIVEVTPSSENILIGLAIFDQTVPYMKGDRLFARTSNDGNIFPFVIRMGCVVDENGYFVGVKDLLKRVNLGLASHELKHIYDKFIKDTEVFDYSKYNSYTNGFPIMCVSRFLFLLYYFSQIENSVRVSELYGELVENGVIKKNFKEFLDKSDILRMVNQGINFKMSDLRKDIIDDPGTKPFIEHCIGQGYERVFPNDDAYEILNLLFINLASSSLNMMSNLVNKLLINNSLHKSLWDILFKGVADNRKEHDRIMSNFTKDYMKYEKNIEKYFEKLEKNINFVSSKLKRKLYKLYDMVPNEKQVMEKNSILNWDKNCELNKSKLVYVLDFEKFKKSK